MQTLTRSPIGHNSNGPSGLNAAQSAYPELPNVLGWWDASDTASYTLNGTKVSQWNSRVGVNHFVQSTDSRRPTITENSLNSLRTINHSGGAVWLNLTTRLTNVRTAIIVMRWTDTTGAYRTIFGDTSNYDWHGGLAGGSLFDGTWASASVRGGDKYVNGVLTAGNLERYTSWRYMIFQTTANTAIASLTDERGDTSRTIKGDVAEIILMSSVITSTDRGAVNSYLSAKWGL